MSHTFELTPRGPFSLAASLRFLEGFGPAAYGAQASDHFHLAFVAEGTEQVAGVCLREEDGRVLAEVFGEAPHEMVERQTARILSLDVDGTDFPAVGQRDPVIGGLQAQYPGLRPVAFFSPYEAAAWTIISGRIRITQAAAIKARMAAQLGPSIEIHGETWHAFPPPARLLELTSFGGLFGRKVEWLRALAAAALEGKLDAERLRTIPAEQAIAELKGLPGVGDFGSGLILLRGANVPDGVPPQEPRLQRAVQRAYGLDAPPSVDEIVRLAEAWRPYRTWCVLLLRASLEAETGEIMGRPRM